MLASAIGYDIFRICSIFRHNALSSGSAPTAGPSFSKVRSTSVGG
jgi:hypothetical protein